MLGCSPAYPGPWPSTGDCSCIRTSEVSICCSASGGFQPKSSSAEPAKSLKKP